MRDRAARLAALVLIPLGLTAALAVAEDPAAGNWPSFRGFRAQGVADGAAPVEWDGASGKNVRWKTAVPGLGHSSPVIWGDRLFVTTAVAKAGDAELKVGLYGDVVSADDNGVQSWRVECLDKGSGAVLWERVAHEGEPAVKRHPKASHANSTPATDGRRVVALFGSEGLYCYDVEGQLLWQKDLGVLHSGFFMMPAAQWGFGSSPVIHDGKVIVQADILKGSFLAVFDLADGHEVWRTARDEFPTWSTPTVDDGGGRALVVVNGFKNMGAYDFATGQELWTLKGGGDIPVPTPVTAFGLAFLTNAHGSKAPVYAVRLDAQGDLTLAGDATSNAGIAWSLPRDGGYMPTPIVYGEELYVCRDNGVLSCFDARTGERHYQQRMASGDGFTSSPVAAGGRVYFTGETGTTHVIEAGREYAELAVNELGETVMATPAISDGTLYFRARHHVVAIAEPVPQGRAASAPGDGPKR